MHVAGLNIVSGNLIFAGGWQYQQVSVCSWQCDHGSGGHCSRQVEARPLQRLQAHLSTQGQSR